MERARARAVSAPPEYKDPLRVLVLDTQGVCSQLFSKQLSQHLNFATISHPYILAATLGPERIHTKLECDEKTRQRWAEQVKAAPPKVANMTYHIATERFLREADRLEQKGKTLFVKEHAAFIMKHDIMTSAIRSHETIVSKLMNPTVLPDELLQVVTPIIFIRHPAMVLPAWLRAAKIEMAGHTVDDEDFTVWTSLRWSRIIFDYLRNVSHQQHGGGLQRQDSVHMHSSNKFGPSVVATKPYVIDAADVMYNTQATLEQICRLLGIAFEGEEKQSEKSKKYFERAFETMKKGLSENVMKNFSGSLKLQNSELSEFSPQTEERAISLDVEAPKWRQEFGPEVAAALRRKVDEELPHYEYLRNFKLRVRPSSASGPTFDGTTNTRPSMLDTNRRKSAMNPSEEDRAQNGFGSPLRIIRTATDKNRPVSIIGSPMDEANPGAEYFAHPRVEVGPRPLSHYGP